MIGGSPPGSPWCLQARGPPQATSPASTRDCTSPLLALGAPTLTPKQIRTGCTRCAGVLSEDVSSATRAGPARPQRHWPPSSCATSTRRPTGRATPGGRRSSYARPQSWGSSLTTRPCSFPASSGPCASTAQGTRPRPRSGSRTRSPTCGSCKSSWTGWVGSLAIRRYFTPPPARALG